MPAAALQPPVTVTLLPGNVTAAVISVGRLKLVQFWPAFTETCAGIVIGIVVVKVVAVGAGGGVSPPTGRKDVFPIKASPADPVCACVPYSKKLTC